MPALTIVFEGLIAFAARQEDSKTVLHVLLPAVGAPMSSLRDPRKILSRHFPLLRFDEKNYKAGLPNGTPLLEREGKREYVLPIPKGIVGFHTGQTQAGIELFTQDKEPGKDLEEPSTADERKDYRWIGPMRKVCSDCGEIDPDCLGADTKGLVAVRAEFREGRLVTSRLSEDKDGTYVIYEFPIANWSWRQAMAEEAAVETSVGDLLQVSGVTGNSENLILKTDGNPLVVTLQNSEIEDLLVPSSYDEVDPVDFELFFELAEKRPPRQPRRIPRQSNTAGDRICPMSWFD